MRNRLLMPAVLSLAACTPMPGPEGPVAGADSCGASALQYAVGRENALAAMTFPDTTRFIGPDTAVTQDYNPERLNIVHDDRGTILRVYCG